MGTSEGRQPSPAAGPAGIAARTTGHFRDVDLEGFWDDPDPAEEARDRTERPYAQHQTLTHTESFPTDELVTEIEAELGYRLPDSYVELARIHNGGRVLRPCFPMSEPTCWADDHIQIDCIYAVGRTADHSLCGPLGSTLMRDEWGYPDIGIGIANTPSGGHEQIMLDYSECGPQGEPRVVHVAVDQDDMVTLVAPDFAAFVRGLVSADEFDQDERDDEN